MARLWAYLMLAGSALFWSGNFVIGRAFATDIAPITISYLRWCLALLLVLPFTLMPMWKQRGLIRSNLPLLVFMGAVGVAGFNSFAYLGLNKTTATNALLINSFIPILIILLSRIIPGTRITPGKLLGIAVSTLGVLLLVSRGQLGDLMALNINVGDLWVLLAALLWAIYSICLRYRPAELSATAFLGVTMIVGVVILSPVYWLNPLQESPFVANSANMAAVGYVAVFASIVAFLFWNQGVKAVGARSAGQFIHLMPVFGTLMAIAFLGEQLYWFHVLGVVAIGSGIYVSMRSGD